MQQVQIVNVYRTYWQVFLAVLVVVCFFSLLLWKLVLWDFEKTKLVVVTIEKWFANPSLQIQKHRRLSLGDIPGTSRLNCTYGCSIFIHFENVLREFVGCIRYFESRIRSNWHTKYLFTQQRRRWHRLVCANVSTTVGVWVEATGASLGVAVAV